MKTTITLLALILLTILCSAQSRLTRQSDKPRLIVMADIDAIGEGKSTEGSELIIRQVTKDDWAHEHIRTGHGGLGELYPMRLFFTHTFEKPEFIEGGGTIPWMSLATLGLTNPSEPSWGGWSGRYTAEKVLNVHSLYKVIAEDEQRNKPFLVYTDAVDHWIDPETGKEHNDSYAGIWHWRQAMWNDFRARMDWCVKPYEEANHNPIAAVNGDTSKIVPLADYRRVVMTVR